MQPSVEAPFRGKSKKKENLPLFRPGYFIYFSFCVGVYQKWSDVADLVHLYNLSLIIPCVILPTLRSLRSQLRSRLTVISTSRDVTASLIRIRSLSPSTKTVLEVGRERILRKNWTPVSHFLSTKTSFPPHFYFCSLQGASHGKQRGLLLQLALVLPVHFPLHSFLYILRTPGLLQLWRHGKGSTTRPYLPPPERARSLSSRCSLWHWWRRWYTKSNQKP